MTRLIEAPVPGDPRLELAEFCAPLIGLPVSHIWRGYGSAIFLEFGSLHPRTRRDGSPGNPVGGWDLTIEWSWRIEGKRRIWCGSWSDEDRWSRAFSYLVGANVVSVDLIGRLPEIDMGLSNGLHVVSMMTSEGDPAWTLGDLRGAESVWFCIRAGRLYKEINTNDGRPHPPLPFDPADASN